MGHDLDNPNPPHYHITPTGQRSIIRLSRDPANPDGYKTYLRSTVILDPIATSYVDEALGCFSSGHFKASAVMIGCAVEHVVLELRDTLVTRLNQLGRPVNSNLSSDKVKTVRDAITLQIDHLPARNLPHDLKAAFDTHWRVQTEMIRKSRNDAGHPQALSALTEPDVHGVLLGFPALAKTINDLNSWIAASYT